MKVSAITKRLSETELADLHRIHRMEIHRCRPAGDHAQPPLARDAELAIASQRLYFDEQANAITLLDEDLVGVTPNLTRTHRRCRCRMRDLHAG